MMIDNFSKKRGLKGIFRESHEFEYKFELSVLCKINKKLFNQKINSSTNKIK